MAAKHTPTPEADTASQTDAAPASAAASTKGTPRATNPEHTEEETDETESLGSFDALARMFGQQAEPSEEGDEEEEDDEAPDGAAEDSDEEESSEDAADEEEPEEGEEAEEGAEGEESEAAADGNWSAQIKALPKEAHPMLFAQKKKIEQLREKRDELREEIDEARSEAETLKSKVESYAYQPLKLEPTPGDALSHLFNESELEAYLTSAQQAREWAEENEDGVTVTRNGKEVELSKEEVRAIRRNAERALEKEGPARREWLKRFGEHKRGVAKAYPSMLSDEAFREVAVGVLRQDGQLARSALHERLAADHAFVALLEKGEFANPTVAAVLKRLGLVSIKRTGDAKPPVKAAQRPPVPLSSAATPPRAKSMTGSARSTDLGTVRKKVQEGKASGLDLMVAHWSKAS
jgi:glucan-binding YG repeat protein